MKCSHGVRAWYCKTCGPKYRMFSSARRHAKTKGREFSITLDDIHIPEFCPIFGFKLDPTQHWKMPSLDRVDNAVGYTPSNIRVISWKANFFKSNLSRSQVEAMLVYMKEGNYDVPEMPSTNAVSIHYPNGKEFKVPRLQVRKLPLLV